MITAFSSLPLLIAPAALNAARCERLSPIAPRVPTWRKSRRVIPSHVVIEPFPVTLSMSSDPFLDERRLTTNLTLKDDANKAYDSGFFRALARFAEPPESW